MVGKRKAAQTHRKRDKQNKRTTDIDSEEVFIMSNIFYNNFKGFDEFNADLTLENVNPWMLIATYTNADAA